MIKRKTYLSTENENGMGTLGDLLSENVGKGAASCNSDPHHGSRVLRNFLVHRRVRHTMRNLGLMPGFLVMLISEIMFQMEVVMLLNLYENPKGLSLRDVSSSHTEPQILTTATQRHGASERG